MPARTSCSDGATGPFGANVMAGTLVVTFAISGLVSWRRCDERGGCGVAVCVGDLDLSGHRSIHDRGYEDLGGDNTRHRFRGVRELRLDQRDIGRFAEDLLKVRDALRCVAPELAREQLDRARGILGERIGLTSERDIARDVLPEVPGLCVQQ